LQAVVGHDTQGVWARDSGIKPDPWELDILIIFSVRLMS